MARDARQLGLAELEQRCLECRGSPAVPAEADRCRLDNKFPRGSQANPDLEIGRTLVHRYGSGIAQRIPSRLDQVFPTGDCNRNHIAEIYATFESAPGRFMHYATRGRKPHARQIGLGAR
jgi:hypothetical protein